ncbi:MAG: family 10 glycosylhydrolase [Bacteroidota bacterium]
MLGILLQVACQPQPQTPSKSDPIRGVWLTNVVSDAMFSKANIEKAVERCAHYGFNTIFVVTWNRGYTLYPSAIMEKGFGIAIDPQHMGRDPLQEVIDAAQAYDIDVYAWFEFGFSSSYQEADGGQILRQKPQWAARDTAGQIVTKNGFQWMNAFDPEVQDFVLSLVKEVTNNYAIKGIQGDDRLPALPSLAGYDDLTVKQYQATHDGRLPPWDCFDPEWVDWRAKRLNQFMERLYRELKSLRPNLVISMSPSIFPWSKQEYLQDWPTWVAKGWVDMICPQIYRYQSERYRYELNKIVTEQIAPEQQHLLFPGILLRVGEYYASDTLLQSFIDANRKQNINGEIFFYYEGLEKRAEFFEQLY